MVTYRSIAVVTLSVIAVSGLSGCMTHETRPLPRINAVQASEEIPAEQLLDVGVRLFDENLPKDEKVLEKQHIFPEVRKAEARYFPMQMRNTLEGTGHWGQVRVMPADADALDVYVSGRILESSGQLLQARCHGHRCFRSPVVPQGIRATGGHPLL